MARLVAWGIGLSLALSAGGCGVAASGGPPEMHPRWESCAAVTPPGFIEASDALKLPRLDDDFTPVTGILCLTEHQKRPGGGTDLIGVEKRTTDLTALLPALRLPDHRRTTGACTDELPFVPWLALLDADGRWVRPGVPVDACGKPRSEFRKAYEALRTDLVNTRVLANVESDEAVTAGCTQTWADMAAVAGRENRPSTDDASTALPAKARPHTCTFAVSKEEQASGKPAGEFVRAADLTAANWTAIRHELVTADPPSTTCTIPATKFAVLHLPPVQIYVQADGCHLALIDTTTHGTSLRQATPALTALLFPAR